MKWLTEYFDVRAMIVSGSDGDGDCLLRNVNRAEEVGVVSNLQGCTFFNSAKTVASPDNAIVEIISPFTFTFKIPFH
jgi:hypothetical protein